MQNEGSEGFIDTVKSYIPGLSPQHTNTNASSGSQGTAISLGLPENPHGKCLHALIFTVQCLCECLTRTSEILSRIIFAGGILSYIPGFGGSTVANDTVSHLYTPADIVGHTWPISILSLLCMPGTS